MSRVTLRNGAGSISGGRRAASVVFGVAVWAAASTTISTIRQRESADLPRLAIEALPPHVRTALERVYADARARPFDASVVGRLAMMLHAYEQYESAERCYRLARQLDPRAFAWPYLAAVIQAERGDYHGASTAFRQALEINPQYLPARLQLADTLMNAGAVEASREVYKAVLIDSPELALAHYGLGRLSGALQNPNTAATHYRDAIDAAPQFGAAHYALALAYRDMGDDDRAKLHLDAFRRFAAYRPLLPDHFLEEVRSLRETARDLIADAARLGRSGRVKESIALHLKVLDIDPKNAQAHINLISLYARAGQHNKAEQHYRAALRLEGNLADAHYNYGVLLAARGAAGAADAFRNALEVNPFHAQAHNNLGALLARRGDLDGAMAHYRQAIASDPHHRGARFNLGQALIATGRPRQAIAQFLRILLPEHVDTPRYMFALSNAYLSAGDVANARQFAERALEHARRRNQTGLAMTIEQRLHTLPPVAR